MNQTVIYNNYKIDITLESNANTVQIKMFDTVSLELFEGSVNANEIYVSPIEKFYQMLSSALDKKTDFAIGITRLTDKIKCKLTYKTHFIELDEFLSLDKILVTTDQIKIAKLERENISLNLKIAETEIKMKELNENIDQLKHENQQEKQKNIDIEIRIKILQEVELDVRNRIKKLEDELDQKVRETNIKLSERQKQVTHELTLKEKRLEDRLIAFEQRELNNLLPKVAEKNDAFRSFILCTLCNNSHDLPPGYSQQINNFIDTIMNNDKEYIVSTDWKRSNNVSTGQCYITNYGKVFLQIKPYDRCWTYCRYLDLKINSMCKLILEIILPRLSGTDYQGHWMEPSLPQSTPVP
jgi:hypothetical protein